ncbi:MAG: hypothetical protein ACXVXZ_10505 [Mycobacteriaceae bacterium]
MSKRGGYGSMADRVANSAPSGGAAMATLPVKHCWVRRADGRVPALLLEWRNRGDGWYGRVVRPVQEEKGWVVVEEWLPAGLLDPAG